MQSQLNYNNYYATFHNNILNIYNSNNKLLSSKAYSNIVYKNETEQLFKASIDLMNKINIV